MRHLGIIGAGTVGQAIARLAIAAGRSVVIAGRRPAADLKVLAEQLGGAEPGAVRDAAALDMVVLAVRWPDIAEVLAPLSRSWRNQILIDATNPFVTFEPPQLAELDGQSASAIVAKQAPGARVVKAFNSVTMANFTKGPLDGRARRVLFVSGDHADANTEVAALIEDMGYRAILLGDLETGGRLQQAGGPLAGRDILLGTGAGEGN
ncbi:NADPH-dependent F420 reductase [Rhizosaccharibacter radicis]|uniref:NAD(P)-binding domain-containing protein n=1 Tax=Rhizosaccharibacter radicis TaxID=2782605 RepID=A0ABT1VVE1_9PROT|nr:NAD(P)-binding domain-containing protein [Acetobacteraceae bacterium KSS12]